MDDKPEKEEYMVISHIKKELKNKINKKLAKHIIEGKYKYFKDGRDLKNLIRDDDIMFITIVESREQLDEFNNKSYGVAEMIYKIKSFE